MRSFKNPSFADRLTTAASARKAQIEKFRAQPGADDPVVAQRIAERQALSAAREARAAEREAARQVREAAAPAARLPEQAAKEARKTSRAASEANGAQ